jgi:hypothetical protein
MADVSVRIDISPWILAMTPLMASTGREEAVVFRAVIFVNYN